jgi:hypothetical protein
MRRNACMETVSDELRAAGIAFTIKHGGKHPKFKFKLGGRNMTYVVSFGSGDRMRGHKNARADIRRRLRQHRPTSKGGAK